MGIPWQTVYWRLKREGVEVVGDKNRYGSATDRVGLIGEKLFGADCPSAVDNNHKKYQPKYDFTVGGYRIDVKTSFLNNTKGRVAGKIYPRWSFNCKVQQNADFLVCYCLDGDSLGFTVEHVLLIPREFVEGKQTISVSLNRSKWLDFRVDREVLKGYFSLV